MNLSYHRRIFKKLKLQRITKVTDELWNFMQHFNIAEPAALPVSKAQGLFGYTTFDAIQFFEDDKI